MTKSWGNISDSILHYANIHPSRKAVIDGPKLLTYREFANLICKTSVYLKNIGITSDSHVGIALVNSADHLILYFGLMRLGATVLEIPSTLTASAIADLVRKYSLQTMFIEADAGASTALSDIRVDIHWRRAVESHHGDARTDRDGDHCRLVALTSGSTGAPRAIVCTQSQRIARAIAYQKIYQDRWSPAQPADFLLSMAISNSGFNQFLINQVLMGGAVIILPYYQHVSDFVRMVAAYGDAVCLVTPDMCRAFLAHAGKNELLLPHLRAMISTGMPLFASEKRDLLTRVTPHFYEAYGASGFGMICALRPHEMELRAETVGRIAADAIVEIVDLDGNALPANAIGHLRCQGATAASGWLSAEDEAATGEEFFRDGFYYPGDIAAIDGAGFVTLKGRRTDMIRQHGIEIYPQEIEQVLASHPMVKEAIVVGRPNANGSGQEAIAYVVLIGSLPHVELAVYCGGLLSAEKYPAQIVYTSAIPRTANGKIDRPAVRAFAAAHVPSAP